jgi:leader peptidase (prepilin peptidase) / N-methyltransferase
MTVIIAFLAGLLIGSFLNVCIYRMPKDLSIVRPRSYCPSCNVKIAWFDNVPLVSYTLLGGRCRHCGARIPFRYPIVEALTALAFAVAVLTLGPTLASLKLCLFAALMIALAFSDLEERILPDEFTLGGMAAGLLLALVVPMDVVFAGLFVRPGNTGRWLWLAESALGAVVSAGLLWVVGFLYEKIRQRSGLGLGDVKMMGTIGAFLGVHGAFQTIILASLIGSVVGLVYIKVSKKDFSSYELPFGTFLGLTALALAFLRTTVAPLVGE